MCSESSLIFVGSEATGYYSGAESVIGVFVDKDYYFKHEEELLSMYRNYNHGEIDGKHSEVEGDLIVREFKNNESIAEFVHRRPVEFSLESYSEELDEGSFELLKKTFDKVSKITNIYELYNLTLTEEEYGKVREYISKIRDRGDD